MELSSETWDMFDDRHLPQGRSTPGPEPSDDSAPRPGGGEYATVPTDDLLPCPWPVRVAADPDADSELEESIRGQGVLVPLLVRRTAAGLEILAGMRRWGTARHIGLAEVPVRICRLTEEQARAVTLLENSARLGLSVWEECRGLLPLLEYRTDLRETVLLKEIKALTGWSIAKASVRRKIVQKLDPEVREKAGVNDADLTRLSLAALDTAAAEATAESRAAVLYEAVHARRAPWMDPSPEGHGTTGSGRRSGFSFRTFEGGRRLTLSVRPDILSTEEKAAVRRSLGFILDALGSDFEDIRRSISAS
jgi:ParB-like chromosome segregation protein Spo0J